MTRKIYKLKVWDKKKKKWVLGIPTYQTREAVEGRKYDLGGVGIKSKIVSKMVDEDEFTEEKAV